MLRASTCTVHPDSLIVSSVLLTDNGLPYTRKSNLLPSKKKININKLSVQSVRKVKKAITYMAHLAPEKKVYNPKYCSKFNFKLSFITLTLSSRQIHTDQEIKSIVLHRFIDYIQKVYKVKHYVWKAERQKNGNVHFHLVIDKFIGYEVIRSKWNEYQDLLGYVNRYYVDKSINGLVPDSLAEYYSVNSTDVHSVRKIKDLKRYLIKYMIKPNVHNRFREKRNASTTLVNYNDDLQYLSSNTKYFLKNMASVGRLWGCSHNLSNITGAKDFLNRDLEEEIERIKLDKSIYIKNESYFLYLGFDYQLLVKLRCTAIIEFLHGYLASEFGYSSQSIL